MTLLTERQSKSAAKRSTESSAQRQVLSDAVRQNADVVRALGMTGRLRNAGRLANEQHSIRTRASPMCMPISAPRPGPALRPAVGGAWRRRLSGGDRAGVRGHHDRIFDRDGACPGAGRGGPGELEAVRRGARGHRPPARDLNATAARRRRLSSSNGRAAA